MSLPAEGRVLSRPTVADGDEESTTGPPSTRAQFEEEDSELREGTWGTRAGLRAAILRNKLLSGLVCAACLLLLMSVALGSTAGPARLPYPQSMCSGGTNGTQRRISRDAYDYWASVHTPPTDNLVIMLADGYGPNYHAAARSMRRVQMGDLSYMLPLDPFLVGGSVTSASSNIITDSAAGATAYAAGQKTFNGALGVVPGPNAGQDSDGELVRKCGDSVGGTTKISVCGEAMGPGCCPVQRLANTLEGCRARGMATGIVVTTVLPHATPAAWSAHVSARYLYDFIAQQQIEADPPLDVTLGGGRRYFDSRRADSRDLLAEHQHRYTIVNSAQELQTQMDATARAVEKGSTHALKPLLGLFSDEDMHYEVDRVHKQHTADDSFEPSLTDMVKAAIARLRATGKHGFCLVVEGSRVDHGGHDNDVSASLWDALAYNDAFAAVLEETGAGAVESDRGVQISGRRRKAKGGGAINMQTQVISVADHSTGGLTLGLQTDWDMTYAQEQVCVPGDACKASLGTYPVGTTDGWSPAILAGAKSSLSYLSAQLCCNSQRRASNRQERAQYIAQQLGFEPLESDLDAIEMAKDRLVEILKSQLTRKFPTSNNYKYES